MIKEMLTDIKILMINYFIFYILGDHPKVDH